MRDEAEIRKAIKNLEQVVIELRGATTSEHVAFRQIAGLLVTVLRWAAGDRSTFEELISEWLSDDRRRNAKNN